MQNFNNLLAERLANRVDKIGLHTVPMEGLPWVGVLHHG